MRDLSWSSMLLVTCGSRLSSFRRFWRPRVRLLNIYTTSNSGINMRRNGQSPSKRTEGASLKAVTTNRVISLLNPRRRIMRVTGVIVLITLVSTSRGARILIVGRRRVRASLARAHALSCNNRAKQLIAWITPVKNCQRIYLCPSIPSVSWHSSWKKLQTKEERSCNCMRKKSGNGSWRSIRCGLRTRRNNATCWTLVSWTWRKTILLSPSLRQTTLNYVRRAPAS